MKILWRWVLGFAMVLLGLLEALALMFASEIVEMIPDDEKKAIFLMIIAYTPLVTFAIFFLASAFYFFFWQPKHPQPTRRKPKPLDETARQFYRHGKHEVTMQLSDRDEAHAHVLAVAAGCSVLSAKFGERFVFRIFGYDEQLHRAVRSIHAVSIPMHMQKSDIPIEFDQLITEGD